MYEIQYMQYIKYDNRRNHATLISTLSLYLLHLYCNSHFPISTKNLIDIAVKIPNGIRGQLTNCIKRAHLAVYKYFSCLKYSLQFSLIVSNWYCYVSVYKHRV